LNYSNTQKPSEEEAFLQALDDLDLVATDVGITCAKERAVTPQNDKARKTDLSKKDYLIVPKNQIVLYNQTVAFGGPPLDRAVLFPNKDNPSDHAAVGAYAKIISMIPLRA
jgi:hypothetical protein